MTSRFYRALTTGEVSEALSYLPSHHKDLVSGRIEIYNSRKRNKKGQIIEGCYQPGMKRIQVYACTPSEIFTKRYLNTVWHEVGHVVFDELLTRQDKIKWGEIREREEFFVDLSDLYSFKDLWEEEFCFIYQMLIRFHFYRANQMRQKEEKLGKALDSMSKRKTFVKKTSKKTNRKNCLKIAQDRVEKIIGPLV